MTAPLLVIDVVGLTPNGIGSGTPALARFAAQQGIRTLQPPLPAVTCTAQATITTGTLPQSHGIVSNGWYFRDSGELQFWKRSDHLVHGEKIWDAIRQRNPDARTANLFWRYCTHSTCDVTVTERPTYWADGRKGPDIYTEPASLRDELVKRFGDFPLFRFWGPATSIDSTRWIVDATMHIMASQQPDLVLTYLPHLDYDIQKYGPESRAAAQALSEVDREAGRLIDAAVESGYDVAVLSEYGMTAVSRPIYLNRVLRQAGLLRIQEARNGELLEPGGSKAFAACSHQVAHIYIAQESDILRVAELLRATDGVAAVLTTEQQRLEGLGHSRSGELVAVAAPDAWFAYPFWFEDNAAPDYAQCVAIHDKPGHDPAEMFLRDGLWGGKARVLWRLMQKNLGLRAPFDVVSLDANKIRGSHGRLPDQMADRPVLLTSWPLRSDHEHLPMTRVKSLLLDRE